MCAEAEAALIARAKRGDAQAMESLLGMHRPLLYALSRRLRCEGSVSQEELVQSGALGLMQAVSRYDAAQGTKLITYAVPWILGEMKRALRQADRTCLSLEEPVGEATLLDVLTGENGISVEGIDLRMALGRLEKQAQTLICLRYFRDCTQKETARLLRMSQAQVSRAERRALDQLHAFLA